MNGVHDMGGMHGLGPIVREDNEPVFHAAWEGRTHAMASATGAWRKWNIDASRHQRELIPGPDYLRMSYYEKWYAGLVALLLKHGLVSAAELASGQPAPGTAKATPPLLGDKVESVLRRGSFYRREVNAAPSFKLGDKVRARNIHPTGHTRLPRYARGKTGEIVRDHGVHVFPDANAHFQGEQPQHLYSVRFAARELWGQAASPRDAVYIDLWDSHLERA